MFCNNAGMGNIVDVAMCEPGTVPLYVCAPMADKHKDLDGNI